MQKRKFDGFEPPDVLDNRRTAIFREVLRVRIAVADRGLAPEAAASELQAELIEVISFSRGNRPQDEP
jgi:hypothetical protein